MIQVQVVTAAAALAGLPQSPYSAAEEEQTAVLPLQPHHSGRMKLRGPRLGDLGGSWEGGATGRERESYCEGGAGSDGIMIVRPQWDFTPSLKFTARAG